MRQGCCLLVALCIAITFAGVGAADGEWSEPYFEASENPDLHIVFVPFEDPNKKGGTITYPENLTLNTTIGIFRYKGTGSLSPVGKDESYFRNEKEGDTWILKLQQTTDYENKKEYNYGVTQGSFELNFVINPSNVNDNPFEIKADNSVCQIKEDHPIGNTDCTFTISDKDKTSTLITSVLQPADTFKFDHDDIRDKGQVNLTLVLQSELDYESDKQFILTWTVNDEVDEKKELLIIVKVEDVNDTPPEWTSPMPNSITILESERKQLVVTARDGDYGIKNPIKYSMVPISPSSGIKCETVCTNDKSVQCCMGENGIGFIGPIDRDVGDGIDSVTFEITATEVSDEADKITHTLIVFLTDENDNEPTCNIQPQSITIPEGHNGEIALTITIDDLDIGTNANYKVELETNPNEININEIMTITPKQGYKNTPFTISVTDPAKLDFENQVLQAFELYIVTEQEDKRKRCEKPISVTVEDKNDEVPIWQDNGDGYTARVQETIGRTVPEKLTINPASFYAIDNDFKDEYKVIKYDIVGAAYKGILELKRDGQNLELWTKQATEGKQLFDYEIQPEVVVTLVAMDDESKVTTQVQLTITVDDVNDELPTITANPQAINIEENLRDLDPANNIVITALDRDTDAVLEVDIDWTKTKAKKNGIDVFEFEQCFEVVKESENWKLKLIPGSSPDYEIYDTLNLNVYVVDTAATEDQRAELTITITILDVNDEKPKFVMESFKKMRVQENAEKDTAIGVIRATDLDTPELEFYIDCKMLSTNTFQITPAPGLVDIDNATGAVTAVGEIKADPNILKFVCQVYCTDGNQTIDNQLEIEILDINNQPPAIEEPIGELWLREVVNTNNFEEKIFKITDGDRDREHKNFTCYIKSQSPFDAKVSNDKSGCVIYLKDDEVIDRENYKPQPMILVVTDNAEGIDRLTNSTSVQIEIEDYNDNDPIIVPDQKFEVKENALIDVIIDTVKANDEDINGNGLISYFLDAVEDNEKLLDASYFNLQEGTGVLTVAKPLKDFYGSYVLKIRTKDNPTNPDDDGPAREDTKDIPITITKYQYDGAKFKEYDSQLVLPRSLQVANTVLKDKFGEPINSISVIDTSGKYDNEFRIETPGGPFDLRKNINDSSIADLFVTKENADLEKIYTLTLSVNHIDAEPVIDPDTMELTIIFYEDDEKPVFSKSEQDCEFDEKAIGILKCDLPTASMVGSDDQSVEYKIIESSPPGAYEITDAMDINSVKVSRGIDLIDDTEPYYILIQAEYSPTRETPEPEGHQLLVNIILTDVNDKRPEFVEEDSDQIGQLVVNTLEGTKLAKVLATDLDTLETITYSVDYDTYEPNGTNLPSAADKLFVMDNNLLKLASGKVQPSWNGRIEFNIVASDGEPSHDASMRIKLYVITEDDLAPIIFDNSLDRILEAENTIKEVLQKQFGYIVGIYKIDIESGGSTYADDAKTQVIAYFINAEDNAVISKDVITSRMNDITFYAELRRAFADKSLVVLNLAPERDDESLEETYKIALIVVSVVSGVLLIGLIGFFAYKIRSQANRLDRLDQAEARRPTSVQVHAPGTNRHMQGVTPAAQTFNPSFGRSKFDDDDSVKKQPLDDDDDDDNSSVNTPRTSTRRATSHYDEDDDEDFVGVENNEIFKQHPALHENASQF